ncbi:nasopharyngeal epithelium specific protein 1 [Holotrichia oblita]|uniref:Nasopharyngeal epithelium specific protein 1 n=1 Tax=Holotrichia oblita TaxID=644536 RepID=A0ACB9TIR6_HOLOL|nr:nasopharyngeal epithelium specific protein 1 [Holotrichia oblita]
MMSSGKKFHRRATNKSKGDHNPAQCNHTLHGKYIHYKPDKATEGKDVITIYDNDGDRELIVPNPDPIDIPGILPMSEFQRLKKQAHVLTTKAKIEMMENAQEERVKLQEESQKRKEVLMKAQLHQAIKQGSKLGKYVLSRAFLTTQPSSVMAVYSYSKHLRSSTGQLSLGVDNKQLIRKELEEEEQRLDMMMEQSRQRAIKAEEEKQELQVNKTKRYVKQVIQQIKENNLQKLMEAERIEEESRMINKANLQMQKEDEERARKKKEEQRRMQEDMKLANENVKRYKRIRQEEERIADLRVKEFMRKKDAREGRREQEQEALKLAKEREIERLRMIQEKAQEQKANVDELNARRAAEEAERAWREKEKEAALKRKQQVIEMKRGREQQIDDMRRAQALEMARDEKECREVRTYIYTYIHKYNVYAR